MRLGFALPQIGAATGPDAIVTVAQHAESLGYNSVWTFERLLYPVKPRAPYPASPDGKLPEGCKRILDPLHALTFVAAQTSKVSLGTSVLNLPFYNPALLARQLASLDVLSKGRLAVGFGNGWSPDEFEAVGVPMQRIGKRSDEYLQALLALWTEDPVSFEGEFFTLAESAIGLKPVQHPHPPIYLAAYTPGAMRRVARFADGWNPAGIPIPGVAQMFEQIKAMAEEAGRDPDALQLIVRANVYVSDKPLGEKRGPFAGTPEQIAADVTAARDIGADELLFDVQFGPGMEDVGRMLERMEQLLELARR